MEHKLEKEIFIHNPNTMSWLADWAKDNLGGDEKTDEKKAKSRDDPKLLPSLQSQQLKDHRDQTWRLQYKSGSTLFVLHTRARSVSQARKHLIEEWVSLGGLEYDFQFLPPLTVKFRDAWSEPLPSMIQAIRTGWLEVVSSQVLHTFKLCFQRRYRPGCLIVQARDVFEARKSLLDALKAKRVHDQSFPFAPQFDSDTPVNVTRTPNPRAELSADLCDLSWAARIGYLEMIVEPVVYFSALDG